MDNFKILTDNDYEEVKNLCKNIWDGCDYIPQVFNKWVNDKNGCFLSLVHNNQIVALGKYSILLDNQGWLEGLRVHPNYRGQGFANKISDKLLYIAKKDLNKNKISSIGMCTHLDTPASIKMMTNRGFKLEQSCMVVFKENNNLEIIENKFKAKQWQISYNDLTNLDYFKNTKNRITYGFTYLNLNEDVYNYLVESNALIEVNDYKGIINTKGKDISLISIDETIDSINTLFNYCVKTYNTQNIEVYITNPTETLKHELKRSGFNSLTDFEKDCVYYLYK
ncbi:MAG: GNAT family N-acetyltransferase [Peptostreptococcaceae bacterium]